jgi:ABC-type transporter Mla subunit MlaD
MVGVNQVFVVAAVILLAVLVGTAVPLLLQLRSTLKSLAAFLDETRPKLVAALDQVTEATGRIGQAAAGVEEGMGKIRGMLDTVAAIGDTLASARETLRKSTAVVSAIGPALAAGVRAFWPVGVGGAGVPPEDSPAAPEPQASGPEPPSEETS